MRNETVLVLDFGGQYNQLIARRVRECHVYCEIKPYNKITLEEIRKLSPVGIIFTGGPNSVNDPAAPKIDPEIFMLSIPVLGICYGAQLMAQSLGGKISSPQKREYGKTETVFSPESLLFKGLPKEATTWMSHTDSIDQIPDGFVISANTKHCPAAAMENPQKKLYALQYHPEVMHTRCV